MRRLVMSYVAVVLMWVVLSACQPAPASTEAQQTQVAPQAKAALKSVIIETLPFGADGYIAGFAVQDIAAKYHPWLRPAAVETPGAVYNVQRAEQLHGKDTAKRFITIAGPYVIDLAKTGAYTEGKSIGNHVVGLGNYALSLVMFVSHNANDKGIEDLAGKTLGLGKKTQGFWGEVPGIYLNMLPKMANPIKPQFVGLEQAKEAFIDKRMDALISAADFGLKGGKLHNLMPRAHHLEIQASVGTVAYIDLGEEHIKRLAEQVTVGSFRVEPNTFEKQPNAFHGMTLAPSYVADEALDDELAYEFVKLLLDYSEKFGEYYATGKTMTPEMIIYGWKANKLHPGAVRAYRDYALAHPEVMDAYRAAGVVE